MADCIVLRPFEDTVWYSHSDCDISLWAYGLALGVVHNPDAAMDVVQEAFLKAHRHLDGFAGQASFYTWLYRIVMNVAIDHLLAETLSRPAPLFSVLEKRDAVMYA